MSAAPVKEPKQIKQDVIPENQKKHVTNRKKKQKNPKSSCGLLITRMSTNHNYYCTTVELRKL